MGRTASMALLAVLLVSASPAAARRSAAPAWSGAFGDGVVVDLARPAVYVMSAEGAVPKNGPAPVSLNAVTTQSRIDAVHPHTGKLLWKTTAAVKPLLVVGDRLLAVGAADAKLGIVVLDAGTGKVAARCPKPEHGASLPIFHSLGVRHGSTAWLVDDQPIIIATTSTYYAGGKAPTPEMLEGANSQTIRAYAVDLSTGCATHVDVPEIVTNSIYLDPRVETHPFEAGRVSATVTSRSHDRHTRMVLQRKEGRKSLPDIVLAEGRSGYVSADLSPDRRHISALHQTTDEHGRIVYDWRIVDIQAGTVVHIPGIQGRPGALVASGPIFITRTGGIVQGVTHTGKVLWTRGVRNVQYSGPYPP